MIKSTKSLLPLVFTFLLSLNSLAQMSKIKSTIGQIEAESHLRFLTADELRGRNTGTIELNIAGRYIAEQFRKYNVMPLGDEDGDFKQRVELYNSSPPSKGVVTLDDIDYDIKTNLGIINGDNGQLEGPIIYIKDKSGLETAEIRGKIVLMAVKDARAALSNNDYVKKMEQNGALGLIEVFGSEQQIPWTAIANYLNRKKMNVGKINSDQNFPHFWIHDPANALTKKLNENKIPAKSAITIEGMSKEPINTFNIIGKVTGTDPVLKEEHIIMCAHYDHVGVQSNEGKDSIYNGTRDNGIGTTGLINAAKYFGMHPPKRSIIIIALTAEEKGLLGSRFYTNNPKIPLEKSVFALNIDNSGYTDTENITLLDTARTNIDKLVYQAAKEAGLGVMGDRIPSQGYYERSDQVSFAIKGVPAVNFKMSMEAFDERISTYYHQANDEYDSIDHEYIYKYWISYIRSAELIANWNQRPYWMPGDKFEAAGNKLYQIKD